MIAQKKTPQNGASKVPIMITLIKQGKYIAMYLIVAMCYWLSHDVNHKDSGNAIHQTHAVQVR